jgi:hypothetical protein
MGRRELPDESGRAHPGLGDDRDHPRVTGAGALLSLAEVVQLGVTPPKPLQAPRHSRQEPRAYGTAPVTS